MSLGRFPVFGTLLSSVTHAAIIKALETFEQKENTYAQDSRQISADIFIYQEN